MLAETNTREFETEESIVRFMNSTLLDKEYRIEHNWKMCFMHPYRYLEHPKYQEKRKELKKSNKSTVEHLGFLLFPRLFGGSNYIPILNKELVDVMSLSKICPEQSLGSSSEGVSLYKSVDVLLKFANRRRCKSPMIAVYKFLEGNPQIKQCQLDEEIEPENLDPNFDSFSLNLISGDLSEESLLNQLRFTEIFFYDTKKDGSSLVVRSYPRQTTPVTLISFLPLLFIVPQPVVPNCQKRRCRRKDTRIPLAKQSSEKPSDNSDETHNGIRFVNSNHDYEVSPPTRHSGAGFGFRRMRDAEQNVDLLNEAAMCAGLLSTPPTYTTQQKERHEHQMVEDLLSGLDDRSINSLCRDAGINLERSHNESHGKNEHEPELQRSAAVPNVTPDEAVDNMTSVREQSFHLADGGVESSSAAMGLEHLGELFKAPAAMPQIVTTSDGCLMMADHAGLGYENESPCLNNAMEPCGTRVDNFFETLSRLLPTESDQQDKTMPEQHTENSAKNILFQTVSESDLCESNCEDVEPLLSRQNNHQSPDTEDSILSLPLTIESPNNKSNSSDTKQKAADINDNSPNTVLQVNESSREAPEKKTKHGVVTPEKLHPVSRKRGRQHRKVGQSREPMPPRRKRAKSMSSRQHGFDYLSSTIVSLAVNTRRMADCDSKLLSRQSSSVEVQQPVPQRIVKNMCSDGLEMVPKNDGHTTNTHRRSHRSSQNSNGRRRGRLTFCHLVTEGQARKAVANIIEGCNARNKGEPTDPHKLPDANGFSSLGTHSLTEDDEDSPGELVIVYDSDAPMSDQAEPLPKRQEEIGQGGDEMCSNERVASTSAISVTKKAESEFASADETLLHADLNKPEKPGNVTQCDHVLCCETNQYEGNAYTSADKDASGQDEQEKQFRHHCPPDNTESKTTGVNERTSFLHRGNCVQEQSDKTSHTESNFIVTVNNLDSEPIGSHPRVYEGTELDLNDANQPADEDTNTISCPLPGLFAVPSPITPLSMTPVREIGANEIQNLDRNSQHSEITAASTLQMSGRMDKSTHDLSVFMTPTSTEDFNTSVASSSVSISMAESRQVVSHSFTEGSDCTASTSVSPSHTVEPRRVFSQSFTLNVAALEAAGSLTSDRLCPSVTSSGRRRRKMFHRRPLVVSRGTEPYVIPLEPSDQENRFDPRLYCMKQASTYTELLPCSWSGFSTAKQQAFPSARIATQHEHEFDEGSNDSSSLSSTTAYDRSEPDHLSSVQYLASNYRVGLLMCREPAGPTDASGPGSFYEDAMDDIILGSSPRDYGQDKEVKFLGPSSLLEESQGQGLKGIATSAGSVVGPGVDALRARETLKHLFSACDCGSTN